MQGTEYYSCCYVAILSNSFQLTRNPPSRFLKPDGGGAYVIEREIYECLSGSFPTFYLGVSGKKRNFAVKLNEWRMKQVEEWEYEASKMAYRDIKNSIDTAKQEGLAEGMEKGMELGMEKGMKKGMKKGMNQKALDIARNMLADGVDINLIMKYSGLTQEQIEKLK